MLTRIQGPQEVGSITRSAFDFVIEENAAQGHAQAIDNIHRYLTNWFRNAYYGAVIKGLPVGRHMEKLKEIGFEEHKALVITWGSVKLDHDGMSRILRGEEASIVSRDRLGHRCKSIDIMRLIRRCWATDEPFHLHVIWKILNPEETDVDLLSKLK